MGPLEILRLIFRNRGCERFMDVNADLRQLSSAELLLLLHNIWVELHNRLNFNLQLQQILSLQTLVLRKSHLCLTAVISIAIGVEGGALGTRLDTDIIPASSTAIGEDEFGIY